MAVSINYRLNGFGFMALPDLGTVDPRGVSGNYGFLDQQLGLRWVQDNIAAFGGDASRVTVWGQSSGGTSVLALLASPASNGLFSRALSLSGSPNITADLDFAYRQNDGFVQQAGCAGVANVTACLLQLSAAAVRAHAHVVTRAVCCSLLGEEFTVCMVPAVCSFARRRLGRKRRASPGRLAHKPNW